MIYYILLKFGFCLYLIGRFYRSPKRQSAFGTAQLEKLSFWEYFKKYDVRLGRTGLMLSEMTKGIMISGPSGSGKSMLLVTKFLFQLAKHSRVALVVNDPKMELWALSSGYIRKKLKRKVYVLNLNEPSASITWDPLSSVEDADFANLITTLYEAQNQKPQESIWKRGAIDIIILAASFLFHYDDKRFLNLPNVLHLLKLIQSDSEYVLSWMALEVGEEIRIEANRFKNSDDRIRNGMLAGAISVISAYVGSDAVKQICCSTTLPSIHQIRSEGAVLFLCTPIAQEKYTPFISLLLTQLFSEVLSSPVSKQDNFLAFLLEELPVLKIPEYSSISSTIRGFKAMLIQCTQSPVSQLKERYGPSAFNILNNSFCNLILTGQKCQETLQYFSRSLIGSSTHVRKSEQGDLLNQRPLLYPDELRRLPNNKVLLVSTKNPVLVSLKPLYMQKRMLREYGLYSDGVHLLSKYEPVRHVDATRPLEYIKIEKETREAEITSGEKHMSFQERLNRLFPKNQKR